MKVLETKGVMLIWQLTINYENIGQEDGIVVSVYFVA